MVRISGNNHWGISIKPYLIRDLGGGDVIGAADKRSKTEGLQKSTSQTYLELANSSEKSRKRVELQTVPKKNR